MDMRERTLYVQMLGGFSMHYGKKVISFNRVRNSKSVRLLQMLLLSVPDGISKNELIDNLYGWNGENDNTDYNNNLNVLIHRLKKQLVSNGLPEGDYIEIQDGICYFKSCIPLEIDTRRFEKIVRAAESPGGAKRELLFLKANKLYCGELLPSNQSDAWFFQKSNYYKNLFLKTVDELEKRYVYEKDTARRLKLYSRAAAIYPYENWQIKQIQCNLEMYRYEEALELYHSTMELYAKEIGSEPPAELHECFEQMELSEEYHRSNTKMPQGWRKLDKVFLRQREDLREKLFCEESRRGAYYCTYPGFVDYCHMVVRSKSRNRVTAVLMFLTLSQKGKETSQNQMNLQEEMERLKGAIGSSLRIGDAYTRYGNRHFILMLGGTATDFCGTIFRRIEKAYLQSAGGGELWYYADMTQELERS